MKGVFEMNTLAYINGEVTTERYNELLQKNVTKILIDVPRGKPNDEEVTDSLDYIVKNLNAGDQLIIYDLSNLHRTLSELSKFFIQVKEKEIDLIILNKEEIFNSMTDKEFVDFIFDLNEENQRVIQEKVKKSIKNPQAVGRPKLSEENIKRIRHLRLDKHYTLKDTAELCGVSVGTVYKYADCQQA